MSDSTLLERLDVDDDKTREIITRLVEEAPSVANAMHALFCLSLGTDEEIDALYDESLDMRRPHVATAVALADGVRGQLAAFLDNLLEHWLAEDDDALENVQEAMTTLGEAMAAVVETLASTPDRRR